MHICLEQYDDYTKSLHLLQVGSICTAHISSMELASDNQVLGDIITLPVIEPVALDICDHSQSKFDRPISNRSSNSPPVALSLWSFITTNASFQQSE